MAFRQPLLSDIRHVVPASQPAWLRIVERYKVTEEDGTETPEWRDLLYPVLAYATLPDGRGAFLVSVDSDGPVWLLRAFSSEAFNVMLLLSLHHEPRRGVEVPGFTDGHKYDTDLDDEFPDHVHWLI